MAGRVLALMFSLFREIVDPAKVAVYLKNFHDSSDICSMGFIYSIQICEISRETFGPSYWKYPMCPMIFMSTEVMVNSLNHVDSFEKKKKK